MSKQIKDAVTRARYKINRIKRQINSAVVPTLRNIDRQLVTLGLIPEFSIDDSGWSISVTGNCNARTLTLAVFQTHGFKPSESISENELYYSTWMRHETLNCFWFSFSNSACERVKVGTKMVEQDIYETRCTD